MLMAFTTRTPKKNSRVTLLPDSVITIDPMEQNPPSNVLPNFAQAAKALEDGQLEYDENGRLIIVEPLEDLSPSGAWVIASGRRGSGWQNWILQDGRPLAVLQAEPHELPEVQQEPNDLEIPDEIVAAVVKAIHVSPFVRQYSHAGQIVPVPGAAEVHGWDARLLEYSYARSQVRSFSHAHRFLFPIIQALGDLVDAVEDWDQIAGPEDLEADQLADLKHFAETICIWGGVPQSQGYDSVWSVVKSAVVGARCNNAPMTSGWTKVAALAAAAQPNPQTIWDSRVSTSLASRLDILPGAPFGGIQVVAGRGGTRPRLLHNPWPTGACNWHGHFSGSNFVSRMVPVLNNPENGYPQMPTPDGQRAPWDVLGVGMVLFMDGY